jgi:hypothetical protein
VQNPENVGPEKIDETVQEVINFFMLKAQDYDALVLAAVERIGVELRKFYLNKE